MFAEGQRVHVEYDGVVTTPELDRVWVRPYGRHSAVRVPAEVVTLLDPAGWPPQKGDIWATERLEYYAVKKYSTSGGMGSQVFLVSDEDGPPVSPTNIRALNPRLVRRRT